MKARLLMGISIMGLIALLVSGCTPTAAQAIEPPAVTPTGEASDVANPAAAFCEAQGYDYEIREAADGGQTGVCVAEDGSECEAWAFQRGECSLDPVDGRADDADDADDASPADGPAESPTYTNADYGFAFSYPPEWTLTEDPGGYEVAGGMASPSITLSRGTLRLHIQYKRPEEMTVLGPGGRPAGQVEERGTTTFLGQSLTRNVLTFEGKDKSVFYGAQLDDLVFYVQLDEDAGQGVEYEAIDLSEDVQAEVDRMIETFSREPQKEE